MRAVPTANGSCYRSHDFAKALGEAVKHRRTRPYRPQTNGKDERFNRSPGVEWVGGDCRSGASRRRWRRGLRRRDRSRRGPHTGIGGLVPADRVHNVTETTARRKGVVKGIHLRDSLKRLSRLTGPQGGAGQPGARPYRPQTPLPAGRAKGNRFHSFVFPSSYREISRTSRPPNLR